MIFFGFICSWGWFPSGLRRPPVAAAANEVYKAAKMDGFGDADFSAVLEALIAAKK